jgi:type I restriction enzyme, S subunit
MNRYESYLETGFEWIGKIPSSWELSRVGKFFTERSEKVDDVTYPPLSVTMNGIVDQLSDVSKSNDNDNRKLVKKDDFVINSRSDRKGSSGIAPRDGSVSLINIVLAPKNIDPKYIENLFKSYYFKEEYFRNGKGIHWDLWTTRWEQFKNINIPIPPIEEQRLISHYLDKKTSQIDSLVEKIQTKIELLKEQRTSLINHYVTKGLDPNVEMKDSGIEWIGEIPKDWDVQRISSLYSQTSIRGFSEEQNLSVFRDHGVVRRDDYENKNVLSDDLSNYKLVNKGDLVLNKMKTWMGSLGVSEYRGIVSPAYYVLRPNFEFFSGYLHHLLRSKIYIDQYGSVSKGVRPGQWDLSYDEFKSLKVILPPVDEQKEIYNRLTKELEFNSQLSNLESKKVEFLEEYRQSLISSIVTGQIRVTEDMI